MGPHTYAVPFSLSRKERNATQERQEKLPGDEGPPEEEGEEVVGGPGSGVMTAQRKAEKSVMKRWIADHAAFVEDAILKPYNEQTGQHCQMTAQQREASEALSALVRDKMEGRRRDILGISIMSGTGTGKDAWLSWAIEWFMKCFPYPKIPCVSVSADQLNKVLWSEISKWQMHSPLRSAYRLQNDKYFCTTVPLEARGKRWMAFPKAANPKDSREEQVEGLGGIHEDFLLQCVDEASGVLHPVFETLEGNMTGRVNVMLVIFNPRRSTGYAVDTQYADSARWVCLRWNAEESEIVDRASIEAKAKKYGTNSNPYRIQVLGLPPIVDEHTLIPWDWIEDAVGRELEAPTHAPVIKGVDCGAGGDNSIICTRKGALVYPLKRLKTADSQVLENWIGTDIDAERADVCRIDTVGIGWAVEGGVRAKKGSMVEAADARRESSEPTRFFNKRAEMYWRVRDAFEHSAISIPDDPELKAGLGATRCEYVNHKGSSVVKIVDKKKIKQELGHSPDEADALALTYYYPDTMASLKTVKPRPVGGIRPTPQAWMVG